MDMSTIVPALSSVMPSLPVADLEQAIAFYTQSLGFTPRFRNGSSFAIVAHGAVELALASPDVTGIPAGHGRCYCKLSDGIDILYADYRSRGVTIRHELRDESYGMREFMIADPDQNEINFGQPMRP
jgi:catechol 2,3-dioxygenase-like lactoylglutathione lyase family enzyme